MQANVIEYELLDRIAGEEGFIWQYDRGQKLKFDNVELPFSYEVHFSNKSSGSSLKVIGDASGVTIPYDVTKTGKPVYLWLYVVTGENAAQTVYGNTIPVRMRAEIATDAPTPEEQGVIEQTIAALNDGIEEVRGIAEGIPEAIDEALERAKQSGEFKGDPGAVFVPSVSNGVVSWSNDGDLPNPDPVDLKIDLGLDRLATKQELSEKADSILIGAVNGIAALDASGRVPSEQLPSYVDDVLEFPSLSQFPNPGETGKLYVSTSNNHVYRWTGTQYIDVSSGDISSKADKRDTVLETTLSRGRVASSTVGAASIAFGNNCTASGEASQAFGNGTNASGNFSHAEGNSTNATNTGAHAEGSVTTASGMNSHAEGINTTAFGLMSHAEGNSTIASNDNSHAEGESTIASGEQSHSEGSLTQATAYSAHAEGSGGTFSVNDTTYISGATGSSSHSEGRTTLASGDGAHSEGYATLALGSYSHSEGQMTKASASASHAEGYGTEASGYNGAHAEGQYTIASNDAAHAEGYGTLASEDAAHAEGGGTNATGMNSHAEGGGTRATGTSSHAEGSSTIASGYGAHSEGSVTQATGQYAHAEGGGTQATASQAHAEGGGSQATGMNAHAEGSGTTASGIGSHSEGGGTQATGSDAHAEGSGTQATGTDAHAEGGGTIASGPQSHAEGASTIAAGAFSHVSGKYNIAESYDNWTEWTPGETCTVGMKRKRTRIIDEETVIEGFVCKEANSDTDWTPIHWINQYGMMNYAEIIGNGKDTSNRSNARTLDWDGNEEIAGRFKGKGIALSQYAFSTGNYAIAMGTGSTASGEDSLAHGGGATASGFASHAQGSGCVASGTHTHASGAGATASGNTSFAHGSGVVSSGFNSTAFGAGGHVAGDCAFSSGEYVSVNGNSTFAFGRYNVADTVPDYSSWPEWVSGTSYVVGANVYREITTVEHYDWGDQTYTNTYYYTCTEANSDATFDASKWEEHLYGESAYAEIVGGGLDTERKANIRTLDWHGNERLMGDIYVGCNPDGTGGTKVEPVVFATDAETLSIFESA